MYNVTNNDLLSVALRNMAKNRQVKKDMLRQMEYILEQALQGKASKHELAWAKRQARGFIRPQ